MRPKYVITGVLKNGVRFKPIHTETPWHYNIWRGTLWLLINGKRRKIGDFVEGGLINAKHYG